MSNNIQVLENIDISERAREAMAMPKQRVCDEWHHISGENNPADVASRGASLEKLTESQLWWRGPVFLEMKEESWPKQPGIDHALDSDDTEFKVVTVLFLE